MRRKRNTTHLARERRPHARCQKTQQMKWRTVRRRLCKPRAPDRTRQWNLSARTMNSVSQRMEICHRVPARIATQSSRGKSSIFSAKQRRIEQKTINDTSTAQTGSPGANPRSTAQPPSDPYMTNRFSRHH